MFISFFIFFYFFSNVCLFLEYFGICFPGFPTFDASVFRGRSCLSRSALSRNKLFFDYFSIYLVKKVLRRRVLRLLCAAMRVMRGQLR